MFAAGWNLRTSYVPCAVYKRLRVTTFRALDKAKNRRITSCCITSCHGLCQDQKVVDSLPLTSKLSFTNAEPSFLKQSSLSFRASQNAFQQLITSKGHVGCKKESNLPRREVTEFWNYNLESSSLRTLQLQVKSKQITHSSWPPKPR
jgi:hypothetical protein